MKTSLISTLLLILAFSFFSCTEEINPGPIIANKQVEAIKDKESLDTSGLTKSEVSERQLFAMMIEGWGRDKGDGQCKGWGLCRFRACLFCCVDENDYKVDCKTGEHMARSGEIVLDGESGFIIIRLDPTFEEEAIAIENQSTLFVDANIETNDLIVLAGEYQFESELQGYKVNMTLN